VKLTEGPRRVKRKAWPVKSATRTGKSYEGVVEWVGSNFGGLRLIGLRKRLKESLREKKEQRVHRGREQEKTLERKRVWVRGGMIM
jgi:hypothetical protein